jgi:hypothetical protein
MGLLDLIGNIGQSGFGQGAQNYIGNDTSFGQDINKIGNIYQGLDKQQKSQLIGQPQQQSPFQNTLPQVNPAPNKADVLKNHLNYLKTNDSTGADDNTWDNIN